MKCSKGFFGSFFGLILPICTACTPKSPPVNLTPPPTPALTMQSSWGVVNKLYLKIFQHPHLNSELAGVMREGDVVEVVSRMSDQSGYWLEIRLPDAYNSGWTPEENLVIYDTFLQAMTAREKLDE